MSAHAPMTLFNPMPIALAHYAVEMVDTLGRLGIATQCSSPVPPTDARDTSLTRRIAAHIRAVSAIRETHSTVLVLWPAFGWVEALLWSRSNRLAHMMVIHDPVPLRQQHGQGRLSRLLTKVALRENQLGFICHTMDAAVSTAAQLGLETLPHVCLHPVATSRADQSPDPGTRVPRGTILVAGQYKPARDMDLLSALGSRLRGRGYRPRIVGRGWPSVAGWETQDGFLTESELNSEISCADIVLLPYHRYWQSGIAVRALEAGVPVVGAATSFLQSLMGEGYPGMVPVPSDPTAWMDAIIATTTTLVDMKGRRADYQQRVDRSWAVLLADQSPKVNYGPQ